MVRVAVSVEGATEERFVKKVLCPYFENREIYLTPINARGNISLDRIRSELQKLAYGFDFVTTLYDFYGFKYRPEGATKGSLELAIKEAQSAGVRDKVIPYVQMYEFEGLLFSDPDAISSIMEDESLRQWAGGILGDFGGNPEAVNDSPQTAPSKRLEEVCDYLKTTHGPNIAEEIGLQKLRDKCAGFNNWIEQLEALSV